MTALCVICKSVLVESPDIPSESRIPCPTCGSTNRFIDVSITGSVSMKSKLSYKGKRGGRGKPFIKGVIGDDLFRKARKWFRLERVIDRDKNLYKEVVFDPNTGEEIHKCEEPLSQHIGHGDDVKNKSSEKS